MGHTLVEEHPIGILQTEGVAVHAVVVGLLVIEKGLLLEIGQVTLIDTHAVPHAVAGSDLAIDQAGVDRLRRHLPSEGGITQPAL